jgi:hypothetical protein
MFSWRCSLFARGKIIEEFSWDWGGRACENFSLGANLWGDRDWRGDADLSLQFWDLRVVGRDSDSILWGDRNWRGDAIVSLQFWDLCAVGRDSVPILWGGRDWRDDRSLSDAEGAAHFVFPGRSNGDFDPSLDVDQLAGDLKPPIPDSDIPRDPGLLVDDSVLGRVFGGRDDSRRRGDIYFPDAAFQNIYLREVAA